MAVSSNNKKSMARGVASCHSTGVLRVAGHGRSSDHGRNFAGHARCSFGRHGAVGDAVESGKIEWRTLARGCSPEKKRRARWRRSPGQTSMADGGLGKRKKRTRKREGEGCGYGERDNVVGPRDLINCSQRVYETGRSVRPARRTQAFPLFLRVMLSVYRLVRAKTAKSLKKKENLPCKDCKVVK